MRSYRIEAWADGRPLTPRDKDIVEGSNHGTALRRGYALVKPLIRRGSRIVTVRATYIPAVTTAVD
jgi:hypothetical protein